ncbi:RES domain-containing protein [Pseudomonas putida]|uniref:RES domain-containing protein n=1 Tax=Pseudomonas putida TaxID=303 RepID=UPI0009539748|nr:RES domain-containing protein [Pseudomonas putida]SIR41594.1 RES domain-containing protein [Pseudomonas putida]
MSMTACCINCFSDIAIKEKINSLAEITRCSHCGSARTNCTSPANLRDKLELFTYGLEESPVGYSFTEILTYHYGIFTKNVRSAADLIDEIFSEQGYSNRQFTFTFDILRHNQEWEEFKQEIKHTNRFFPQASIYSTIFRQATTAAGSIVLFQLIEQLKTPIYPRENFYRARISDSPLKSDQMGSPPASIVSGGRANPVGVPYLYLAENIETCINEVRPTNSTKIYVSEAFPKNELFLLDLTEPRTACSAASFEEDQLELVLNLLNLLEIFSNDLSKPVRPENGHLEYIPTQFLCEFIKTEARLDGIIFNSSFASGKNYVVFDTDSFNIKAPTEYTVMETSHRTLPLYPQ